MSVSKIGILTFHRCINYGSYWQARALSEGLQAGGNDTSILDHESPRVNFAEWKCALQPVLPTAVPASDRPLYKEKMSGFFKAFESMALSPRFNLDDPSGMDPYDVVVVGSDEVWNLYHPWYGNCPLFYGDGLKTKRLVSYAASFGNHNFEYGLNPDWAEKLRNFDSISVRDENSQNIVRQALGFEPPLVLDPCLQFPIEPEYRELVHLQQPYVAVYGHNFTQAYVRQVQHWARERNLPLVSIGYRNDWADEQWITADPHEFAHFMAGSEAVATNFFHGCVFALRNARPFVCETTPYRTNKLKGLMAKIGGTKHLLAEDAPASAYHKYLSEPLDPSILTKIERLRQASNEYLQKAGLFQFQPA